MNRQTAQKLIDKTADDYNLIADQFASTRKFNWPDIKAGVDSLGDIPNDAKILDVGCGAGRVSELFPEDTDFTGIDLSPKLIEIAKRQYPSRHFLVGNAIELPFPDNSFDYLVSIATIHHIPSGEFRRKAISEMYRVLKPGGKLLISVWYFWDLQNFRWLLSKKTKIIGFGDLLMPWRENKGNQVTTRYLHAWRITELKNALKEAKFTDIELTKSYRKEKNNLIVTAKNLYKW